MKYARLGGFEKHLQAAFPHNFSQVYLIISKDEGERKVATQILIKELEKGLNTSVIHFSGKKREGEKLFCELETLSFLQNSKLIWLSEVEELEKGLLQRLAAYVTFPTKGVYLILSASQVDLKSAFYKNSEKHGVVLEIAEEKPWEKEKTVLELLAKEVEKEGKKMASPLIQALIKGVGTDTLLLLSELKKLICFVGDKKEITGEDLQAVCIVSSTETNWQLGEALFNRKTAQALKIVRSILAQEISFIALLRQLRSQFQTAFQVGSTERADLKKEFPSMKDFALEKNLNFAQNYGLAHFPKALLAIDEVEFMAKNGIDQYDFLADLLIFKLAK